MLLNFEAFDAGSDPNWVTLTVGTTRVRTGTYAMVPSSSTEITALSIPPSSTVIVGFALYAENQQNQVAVKLPAVYGDGGATLHANLGFDSGGHLQLKRGSTVVALSTQVFPLAQWHYVEMKATVADTGGIVIVRVDGVEWINFTGDTKNAGTATLIDRIGFGTYSAVDVYVDDLYIANAAGTVNNDFLGDHKVEVLFPNGNGASSQWIGSDGNSIDNYALVDEVPINTADYVSSSTLGDRDLYTFTDLLTAFGTVRGVQHTPYTQKSDAGVANLISLLRLSDGTIDRPSSVPLSTSWSYAPGKLYETKPDGAAWTISDVNGAQFGAEVA